MMPAKAGKIAEDVLGKVLKAAYGGLASAFTDSVAGNVDIISVAEEKVNAMSVKAICMGITYIKVINFLGVI